MGFFTGLIITIHVAVSLGLMGLILLHAGRGGGMSDMFGGGMAPQQFKGSTVVEKNLDRLTYFTSGAFAVTTVILVILLG